MRAGQRIATSSRGANGGTGIGLVEVYDLDDPTTSVNELGNLSVRAQVLTGDDVLIGGLIISSGSPKRVVTRGIGPDLRNRGVSGELQDPTLTLNDANGTAIGTNNDWQDASNASDVRTIGLAPADARESAILTTLRPGQYTAVVRGANGATGIALV